MDASDFYTLNSEMEDGGSEELRAPRYPEEDTRETSQKEIRGWYCSGLAAEVFAVCGVGEMNIPCIPNLY